MLTITKRRLRAALLSCSAFGAAGAISSQASAQAAGDDTGATLTEIVVTAQKRAQNLQDVPIAVTALTAETLQANRVSTVNDLSGLAPGVTVRPSVGGVQIPSFTVRGAVSYGVVPGSDKQVSIYLDGVYISSPRGSIFDLPDVERIEMLRGPQGTLFGRNATAGAVSVTTRDPTGEYGGRLEGSVGNYDSWRVRASLNTPQIGPLSGYFSYMQQYKRGDIRNLAAGQVWDRTASTSNLGTSTSPKYLGTIKTKSYFGAIKFEPSDNFKMVYKYDHFVDNGTPEGTALFGYNPASPLIGSLLQALITSQPTPFPIATDGKRPKAVSNSFAGPRDQSVTGHSLTATWRVNDDLTVKNIFAYRKSHIFTPSPFDGMSALRFTSQAIVPYATFVAFSTVPNLALAPAATQGAVIGQIAGALGPLVGQPFAVIASQSTGSSEQLSDEIQVNYDSKLVTLTTGALWFKGDDNSGSPRNMVNTLQFTPVPGGVLPLGDQGISYNRAQSIAAYAQAEIHVTSQLDILGGARITRDKKSGVFVIGQDPNFLNLAFSYKKTKPNYMVGVNYKPTDDILLYGKYSTAFVSGGSVAGIPFQPETARSWEGGVKASFFHDRLRSNLAVYTVKYRNFQTAQQGPSFIGVFPNAAQIAVFVYPQGGPVKSKGFELETTALPMRHLTVGGSLGYSDTDFSDVDPILIAANFGGYEPTLRPKWTGNLWAQYESDPLFGDSTLMLRADGNYRSRVYFDANRDRGVAAFANTVSSGASWIVNGRAALRHLKISGVDAEFAVWGRNITNNKSPVFVLNIGNFSAGGTFEPARTFGADLILNW
jgi:iron complex outermembrane receptor protein